MNRPEVPRLLTATVLVVVGGLAGCSADSESGGTAPTASQRPVATSSTSTTTTLPPLPVVVPYQVVPGEPGADAKLAAARFIEAATNFGSEPANDNAFNAALATTTNPAAVEAELAPLRPAGSVSVGQIVYPQMGGLLANRASVMVILRQSVRTGGAVTESSRTIDVRVDRIDGIWTVADIDSIGAGNPPAAQPPDPSVQALLDNGQVSMPDSARADLLSGLVDPRIVNLLNQVALTHALDITVFATGHPSEVFGSTSESNHTAGRGVDIWSIDGRPVFEQRQDAASGAHDVVSAALAAGATEVGSPWDLDGPGGASFANELHQDHVHLAFDQ